MPCGGIDDAHGDGVRKEPVSPMKQRQAAPLGRPLPAKLAFELAGRMKAMSADQSGVAAIELGIFALLPFVALANVVDVTMYLYQRMQAENATQVAAQAVW